MLFQYRPFQSSVVKQNMLSRPAITIQHCEAYFYVYIICIIRYLRKKAFSSLPPPQKKQELLSLSYNCLNGIFRIKVFHAINQSLSADIVSMDFLVFLGIQGRISQYFRIMVYADTLKQDIEIYALAEYETEETAEYAVELLSGLVTHYNRTLKFAISRQDKLSANMASTSIFSNSPLKSWFHPVPFNSMEDRHHAARVFGRFVVETAAAC